MSEIEPAPSGEEMGETRILTSRKNKPPISLGRPEFDKQDLAEFKSRPMSEQRKAIERTWSEVAYILASRVRRFGMTVTTKDFGRLQQLTTSAAIAKDKVFPKAEAPLAGNIVLNLFGSLGSEKVLAMVAPPTPAIDVECKEVPSEASKPEPGSDESLTTATETRS